MKPPGWRRTSDPYLDWARLTGFAGHSALAGGATDGYLPLLLQAPLSLADSHPGWHVPQRYRDLQDPGFWTAWVPAPALHALPELAVPHAMSLPMRGRPQTAPCKAGEVCAPELVVGVIDNGCAFLNRVFGRAHDPACSRFLGLWRQRATASAHVDWQVPADFGYGLALSRERLCHWHARCNSPDAEAAAYQALGYPLDAHGRLSPMLHGTHVLDIAAGLPQGLPASAGAKPGRPDAATRAGLVFVELPEPLADDTTGAAQDAYILDAVHYILSHAGPDTRVVINLSIGAQAGSHDGGSLIEQALDALIRSRHGRLSICVAAGNGAQERWHAGGLLRGRATQRHAHAAWRTVPGDTTDSFLELWATARDPAALAGLQLRLTAPGGQAVSATLDDAEPAVLRNGPDGLVQALLDLRPMAGFEGHHRAMALVSLAPTAGDRAGQPAGLWRLELSTPRPAPGAPAPDYRVALWLQRDTPGRSLEAQLQSQLEALSPNLGWQGGSATSHLATAREVVAVGAARLSDGQPSAYSPQSGIDLWATADESSEVLGLLCSGGLSGSVFRISGTSAAAPLVARALCNGRLPPPVQRGRSPRALAGRPGAPTLVRPDQLSAGTDGDASPA